MFQQGKRIQNLNEDHQGTRLLLDNHLLRLERWNLDVDGHLGIINSRIDRHRRDVASLEQRLDDLEASNTLLTAKVATMEPRLCHFGREGGVISFLVSDSTGSFARRKPGTDPCEDRNCEGGTTCSSGGTGRDQRVVPGHQ